MKRRSLIMMALFIVGSLVLFLARLYGVKPLFNGHIDTDEKQANITDSTPVNKSDASTNRPIRSPVIKTNKFYETRKQYTELYRRKLNTLLKREKERSGPFANLDTIAFFQLLQENNVNILTVDADSFDLSKLISKSVIGQSDEELENLSSSVRTIRNLSSSENVMNDVMWKIGTRDMLENLTIHGDGDSVTSTESEMFVGKSSSEESSYKKFVIVPEHVNVVDINNTDFPHTALPEPVSEKQLTSDLLVPSNQRSAGTPLSENAISQNSDNLTEPVTVVAVTTLPDPDITVLDIQSFTDVSFLETTSVPSTDIVNVDINPMIPYQTVSSSHSSTVVHIPETSSVQKSNIVNEYLDGATSIADPTPILPTPTVSASQSATVVPTQEASDANPILPAPTVSTSQSPTVMYTEETSSVRNTRIADPTPILPTPTVSASQSVVHTQQVSDTTPILPTQTVPASQSSTVMPTEEVSSEQNASIADPTPILPTPTVPDSQSSTVVHTQQASNTNPILPTPRYPASQSSTAVPTQKPSYPTPTVPDSQSATVVLTQEASDANPILPAPTVSASQSSTVVPTQESSSEQNTRIADPTPILPTLTVSTSQSSTILPNQETPSVQNSNIVDHLRIVDENITEFNPTISESQTFVDSYMPENKSDQTVSSENSSTTFEYINTVDRNTSTVEINSTLTGETLGYDFENKTAVSVEDADINALQPSNITRRKRSTESRVTIDEEIAMQNVAAVIVITNNKRECIRTLDSSMIRNVSNTGAPVFIVTSPALVLRDHIQPLQRSDNLQCLKPYYLASSTQSITLEGGVHVPAGWSMKTFAVYSYKTSEYIVIYDPTLIIDKYHSMSNNMDFNYLDTYSNIDCAHVKAMGIYGKIINNSVFKFSYHPDRARILPLTSVTVNNMEMLFIINAGSIHTDDINSHYNMEFRQKSQKKRDASLGIVKIYVESGDKIAPVFRQLHKVLSSKRKDVFGIANNPEGYALLASACIEINSAHLEISSVIQVVENDWYELQKATGSNVNLVLTGVDQDANITRVYGFIVDEVTGRQQKLYSNEFGQHTWNDEGIIVKFLYRGKSALEKLNYYDVQSESDADSTSFDDDTTSGGTFTSTSYIISNDEYETSDDALSVDSDNDDRAVVEIESTLNRLWKKYRN